MVARKTIELEPITRRFVVNAGKLAQSFGVGRNVGQIYAFLYFSPEPRTLSDMQAALGISKGSASMCVRQLEQWRAVEKSWVKGDRRDFYVANEWLGRIVKHVAVDLLGRQMGGIQSLFEQAEAELNTDGREDGEFVRERVAHLKRFYSRAEAVLANPIVQHLLQ